jgi:dynein heavy chain, axonemal
MAVGGAATATSTLLASLTASAGGGAGGAGGGGVGGVGGIAGATEELARLPEPVALSPGRLGVELLGLTLEQGVVLRESLAWFEAIKEARAVAAETLEGEKRAQLRKLELSVGDFEDDLGKQMEALAALERDGDIGRVMDVNRRIASIRTALERGLDTAEKLNREQNLLQIDPVDWSTAINDALQRLGPHERFWKLVAEFLDEHRKWFRGPLRDNNPELADKSADQTRVGAIRALKELPEAAEAPKAVAQRVRVECEQFLKDGLPLLTLLANPGLKERHWKEMEGIVGRSIPHAADVTLTDMLEIGLEKRVNDIEETCVNASKEFSLEKALERMQNDWKPLNLELRAHKDTGTFILTGGSVDAVQALLDDHIVKAQTMSASRYAKPLLEEILGWVETLTSVQNVLDQWIKVQTSWLYLEPIFSSEDIMRQMPVEGQRFRTVDGTWRRLMRGAVQTPKALAAMQQEGMQSALEEANRLLDLIAKGLNSYLETKRLFFPRFFFLSNDELLEILAETKDPLRVQPHLKKCFEGVKSVEFDASVHVTAMVSAENEVVRLERREDGSPISPADTKGNVEVWLGWLESSMRRTVARVVDEAMEAYPKTARTSWVREHAGQAVLAASQTFWTYEVEEAIRAHALPAYAKRLADQINDIIFLVRGKLSKLERATLSALTVLDVHSRDVTRHLAEVGVDKVVDFEWNSQLRYYWKNDGFSRRTGSPGSLELKMINAKLNYAGEYLGNSARLVITPLTDRCYRTLMGALHLQLGGAPEGPAGTGKTETVKDLGKAVAMMTVVFNVRSSGRG